MESLSRNRIPDIYDDSDKGSGCDFDSDMSEISWRVGVGERWVMGLWGLRFLQWSKTHPGLD